jgi:hypothetical protein
LQLIGWYRTNDTIMNSCEKTSCKFHGTASLTVNRRRYALLVKLELQTVHRIPTALEECSMNIHNTLVLWQVENVKEHLTNIYLTNNGVFRMFLCWHQERVYRVQHGPAA